MRSNNTFDLIFQRWKAALSKKSKKRDDVDGNFDEIFEELKRAGAALEDAQKLLPEIVKAHLPNQVVAKFTWNAVRKDPKFSGITEHQYVQDWNQDINNQAVNSMFTFFPIVEGSDDDGTPKVYGGGKVSVKEYMLSQRHAETFEMIGSDDLTDTSGSFVSEEEMLRVLEGKK